MSSFKTAGTIVDVNAAQGDRLLVGGGLLYASVNPTVQAPGQYIEQTPREAGALWRVFSKSPPKMYVRVHPDLVSITKAKVGFLVDGYLAWGRRQRKGIIALVGGLSTGDYGFQLDVLVFDRGQLIDIFDKQLPSPNSPEFQLAAQSVVGEIRDKYKADRIVLAAPLVDLQIPGTEHIGAQPLKLIKFARLTLLEKQRVSWYIPAAASVAGMAFYVGAIALPWSRYATAVDDFERAAKSPEITAHGGLDAGYKAVMSQRRHFMEAPRRQQSLPSVLLSIVRGVGVVPGIRILEMRLPAPSVGVANDPSLVVSQNPESKAIGAGAQPDVQMRLSVAKSGTSAMEQGKAVIGTLSESTGMELRIVPQGWRDEGDRRVYTIEGFMHG